MKTKICTKCGKKEKRESYEEHIEFYVCFNCVYELQKFKKNNKTHVCNHCNIEKKISEFYISSKPNKDRKLKYFIQKNCKKCAKKIYQNAAKENAKRNCIRNKSTQIALSKITFKRNRSEKGARWHEREKIGECLSLFLPDQQYITIIKSMNDSELNYLMKIQNSYIRYFFKHKNIEYRTTIHQQSLLYQEQRIRKYENKKKQICQKHQNNKKSIENNPILIPERYIANILHISMLQIKKYPELVKLKRAQLQLYRNLSQTIKNQKL